MFFRICLVFWSSTNNNSKNLVLEQTNERFSASRNKIYHECIMKDEPVQFRYFYIVI